MNGRTLLIVALLAGSSSGCATVLRPLLPARQVAVSSSPEGAAVLLDGRKVGQTPCTIRVPHSSDGLIELELEGYRTHQVLLEKRTYWPVFLDLVPILLYPLVLVIFHNNDNTESWRDDFLPAAGISLGAAAGALLLDTGTGSYQYFPKHIPSIQVTLVKRSP